MKITFEDEKYRIKRLAWKLRFAWENLTRNRRIRFTWGGTDSGGYYTVFLRTVPAISAVYEPIIFGVDSCHEAQQIAALANQALKRWAPRLLHKDAELPGVGFQYSKPAINRRASTQNALKIARCYGGIDGDHHKAWVIDQMVRAIAGDGYPEFIAKATSGEDGPQTYEWDEGIAP